MKSRQIIFPEKNKSALIEVTLPDLKENDVLVKTCFSTISAGTERANITGSDSVNAGTSKEVSFPRALGYSSSGVVEAVGSEVKSILVGDRVCMFGSLHKSFNILNESNVVKIECDKISLKTAALAYIATFPLAAIRKTQLEIGESALVMGLGPLGLLAVKLLRAAGAVPIIAVDLNEKRRESALENGADYAFDPYESDFAEKVKQVTDGGVNAAIEVTGVGAGLDMVLDCMARFGRVALLGCTRSSDFTIDYYRKVHFPGISLIGAHTCARPESESHPGAFTHRDDIKALLKLSAVGRLDLDSLIEEIHSPEECSEVYSRLIHDKDFPIAVQFDWSR